jgi:predicted benzoate:H+ symporter BenE
MRSPPQDLSLSAATAGFIAVLVGFTSSVAIVFSAATALRATPALITFLVTLSGVSLAGIGSAFWGVVAGALAFFVQQWRPRAAA